jgi:putative chitinase
MIDDKHLKAVMPQSTFANRTKYLQWLNLGMTKYSINTKERIAMFLATLAVESGQLKYSEEIASGAAYELRGDLGNLRPEALEAAHAKGTTTGRFYKGHGLIQTTGYDNHADVGKELGIDTVNFPRLLCEPKWAAFSACYFVWKHGCNKCADDGDFKKYTKKVNGGYNGMAKRAEFLGRAISAYA